MNQLSRPTLLSILLICCTGAIVYSNTWLCSFQFDDKIYILNNISIRDIANLLNIFKFCPCRFLTFLSIAINYHCHQLNVIGYHLFNIAIHIACALLVWWLTLLTFSTPLMKKEKIADHANIIALFAGLIFVTHPIQIESVTYIWQRATSMAALFYLMSLCFYIKSRQSPHNAMLYYISALITAVMAMFTKESAVTLPLMILLYEYTFLKTDKDLNWKYLTPFLITLFIIPLTLLITALANNRSMRGLAPEEASTISSAHYLFTQFRVIVTYIRLTFLPLNQNLDYDYPVFKSIFELPVFTSFLFLISILYAAKCLFSKYRLISFSILWFFLALLPDSSFFPLQDVIFEHRLYLPLAGYSLFLAGSAYYLFGKKSIKTMIKILTVIIVFNSILAYQRNGIWKDELTLWSDTIAKSPHKERPYNNRGLVWSQQGNFAQAIADYSKAIDINPRYINAYINRGFAYAQEGNFPQSIADYSKAIDINPNLAEAYINRGNVYEKENNFIRSMADYNKALQINPHYAEGYNDRGNAYLKYGHLPQAILDYTEAVELKPDYEDAYYNLGFACYKNGDLTKAIFNYNKAIEINPNDTQAKENRDAIFNELKDKNK